MAKQNLLTLPLLLAAFQIVKTLKNNMHLLVGPNIHVFHLFLFEENVAKLPGRGLEQPCTCPSD